MYQKVIAALDQLKNEERAQQTAVFFKTQPGEYGAGDTFIGISVPEQRAVAKAQYAQCSQQDITQLLQSGIHEHRLTGLLILVEQYKRALTSSDKKTLVDFYLKQAAIINNWDLVDCSAPYILGDFLLTQTDRSVLRTLATASTMWQNRIAIVSTWPLIKQNQLDDTLNISTLLLPHPHDLIHKAVGWMLREAGKQSPDRLREFLAQHVQNMSRTTLRYAIEKFSPEERKEWLAR